MRHELALDGGHAVTLDRAGDDRDGAPRGGAQGAREGGVAVAVEVWSLEPAAFASFVAEVPPPMAIGTVELQDGRQVPGFVCEPYALDGARDISGFGGWRAYLESR